jgi:5-methyltetrahydrofolate--homocysteine methyltransferase
LIVIGERINATRPRVRKALEERDDGFLAGAVRDQADAGADYIDLNTGSGSGSPDREIEDMKWLIDVAIEAGEKPLCIDSADPEVLSAAAEYIGSRRPWMLNSVKGDPESLGKLLPLVGELDLPFVALAMDAGGIPRDLEGRLAVCGAIYLEMKKRNIEPSRVFFDPLVIPLVADAAQVRFALDALGWIPESLPGCRTVLGLSNVSHGLPQRVLVNRTFLTAAVLRGLDAAILDPLERGTRATLFAAEALAGADRGCRRYARAWRRGLLDEEKGEEKRR